MRLTQLGFAALCLVGTLALPTRTDASSIAIESFTGTTLFTAGSDQLYGWSFDVLSAIDVTALGVYDTGSDGLADSHEVGIYRVSDQSLLGSATVPSGAGGFTNNSFRYVALGASIQLVPDEYIIVMTMPGFTADTQPIQGTGVTTAAEIKWLTSQFDLAPGLALHYPNSAFAGMWDVGMFGPNFEFEPVPEPASLVLVGCGLVGFVARRRARRQ